MTTSTAGTADGTTPENPWGLGDLLRAFKDFRVILLPFVLLLCALLINKGTLRFVPALWLLIPIVLAVSLWRVRAVAFDKSTIRLWQFIGFYSAIYSLLHYPLLPIAQHDALHIGLYALLLSMWVLSLAAGALCFWVPSLSVLPPSFLVWSNTMAGIIAGLPTTTYLDVQPLPEIALCIAFGLLIIRLYPRFQTSAEGSAAVAKFATLLPILAIVIHLANYFWSFMAKMRLHGPFGAWLTKNNPAYIYLVALDDGHILFSGLPAIVRYVFVLTDKFHPITNFLILTAQCAALVILLFPKRALIWLLLFFDVMHLGILFIAGANFWPWIILNVIITLVVASRDFQLPPRSLRLIAMGFMVVSPLFVAVARLGWFDTGANNKIFFLAVDESGQRHDVPANYFTFYSYSFGHMDYGAPDPDRAFATQSPNGGTADYGMFQAGRNCRVAELVRSGTYKRFDAGGLSTFIRNYHSLAMDFISTIGTFPYDFYPHHFYSPRSATADFLDLDKRRIVAYIYRMESVCLTFDSVGGLRRKLVNAAEFRIDLTPGAGEGRAGSK